MALRSMLTKSKFFMIVSTKYYSLYTEICACSFSISGKVIKNVNVYFHLGHIIASSLSDPYDITNRRFLLLARHYRALTTSSCKT